MSVSTVNSNASTHAVAGSFAAAHVTIPATKWNAFTYVRAAHKYPTRRPRP